MVCATEISSCKSTFFTPEMRSPTAYNGSEPWPVVMSVLEICKQKESQTLITACTKCHTFSQSFIFFSNVPWKSFLRENSQFFKEEISLCHQDQKNYLFLYCITGDAVTVCITTLQHNTTSRAVSLSAWSMQLHTSLPACQPCSTQLCWPQHHTQAI